MLLILLVITILLIIADRLLINYGECKISVLQEDMRTEFVVQGGNPLLSYLTENGVNISSSCGGKATCGYCKVKVLSGGGEILPTEEIFMSREEKREDMRLACQVKVRNDIEVYIPDFLTTVKKIVENQSFDPKLDWAFKVAPGDRPEERRRKEKLKKEEQARISDIIEEYADVEGRLVPILQEVNDLYGYLPETALRYVSESLDFPLSEIFRIATFYNAFSLKPRGKYVITVCLGTACHVKRAGDVISAIKENLGIGVGETTDDMMFTLETVRCIGCCGLAPVVKANEEVHGVMNKNKAQELLRTCREAGDNVEA
jgi:NADH:ubiquinone oxidoreductase subunit E/ferredoxin